MNPSRFVAAALAALGAGAIMIGCTPQLASWETIRHETDQAMAAIVELLLADSAVEDLTDPTPFGCEHGVMYTGHLVVDPGPDFDAARFIDALPEKLGPSFEPYESKVELDMPNAAFYATEQGNALITINSGVNDKSHGVDILAMSRRGESPDAP
ncbi:hypothetical protein [Microbacterium arborescens]